ncbi:MAG TPA: hypothetical protein VEQ58_01440, partial [Polyangiaceae bacterium]|nr:hypothetical protein [Polyangiaceae bacterium]
SAANELFAVSAAGKALPSVGNCRVPCEGAGEVGGCPTICFFPSALTLQPGETARRSWSALFQVSQELPKECSAASSGVTRCDQAKLIDPGTYTFKARAGSSLDCADGADTAAPACAVCTPDGSGGCATPHAVIAGNVRTATATVQLDSSYGLYGAPQPAPANPGNDAAPLPALRRVQIVFSD